MASVSGEVCSACHLLTHLEPWHSWGSRGAWRADGRTLLKNRRVRSFQDNWGRIPRETSSRGWGTEKDHFTSEGYCGQA